MYIKKHILWFLLAIITHNNINAIKVNIELDIAIETEYSNCQPLAEKIRRLVEAFVLSSDDAKKKSIAKKIKRNKRKLKLCEKANSSWFNKSIALNGGQAGISYYF